MAASILAADVAVTVVCLSLTAGLVCLRRGKRLEHLGYVLGNEVTHARLLPEESTHAFTYSTLSFLVSLKALESHLLDLGRGWIFGYGGLLGRLVGLRPDPYLEAIPGQSIQDKLRRVLDVRGFTDSLEDSWMLTMPSYLGFEGINPLTVYFCYKPESVLWLVVLEVHNTFGESHVHILEVNETATSQASPGYDYDWTFPREFHVSPFNDRSGFYKISIRKPNCAPGGVISAPFPIVRVHQHTGEPDDASKVGPLKLTALLRPMEVAQLTTPALLSALACAPFTLLLSMARIFYHAYILHYKKRLDVYIRPDPFPANDEYGHGDPMAGSVRWQGEGLLERRARLRVEEFITSRTREIDVAVNLIPPNPLIPVKTFVTEGCGDELTVSYRSSRFFAILFMTPSPEHALLLSDGLFTVSSRELFLRVFSVSQSFSSPISYPQRLRKRSIPATVSIPVPSYHYLDHGKEALSGILLSTLLLIEELERNIFALAKARPVVGDEPWRQWEKKELARDRPWVGSVVRA